MCLYTDTNGRSLAILQGLKPKQVCFIPDNFLITDLDTEFLTALCLHSTGKLLSLHPIPNLGPWGCLLAHETVGLFGAPFVT